MLVNKISVAPTQVNKSIRIQLIKSAPAPSKAKNPHIGIVMASRRIGSRLRKRLNCVLRGQWRNSPEIF